uniref:Uncharacterized protein n=1 Tax=Anguilla anguilla TaxID=7936 RepID=A0A0E9XE18_ANGAN
MKCLAIHVYTCILLFCLKLTSVFAYLLRSWGVQVSAL